MSYAPYAGTGTPEGTCNCREPYGVPGGQCRNCGYTLVAGQFFNPLRPDHIEPLPPDQSVTIQVKVTIRGEWVTPEVIADTAHALAAALGAQLTTVVPVTLDVPVELGIEVNPDEPWPGALSSP